MDNHHSIHKVAALPAGDFRRSAAIRERVSTIWMMPEGINDMPTVARASSCAATSRQETRDVPSPRAGA